MKQSPDFSALQSAFESLSDPVAVLNQEGIIQYTNQSWQEFRTANDFFPAPREGTNYLQTWKTISQTQTVADSDLVDGMQEVIEQKRDLFTFEYPETVWGGISWIQVKVTPFVGEEYAAVVTYNAITDQIQGEAADKTLFANSLNGLALHKMIFDEENNPTDYIFLQVNDTFKAQVGLETVELIGKRVTEVFPRIKEQTNFIAHYGQVVLREESLQFESYVESLGKWYRISAYPVGKDKFVTNSIDITEKKKVEEKLKASEKRYRNFFNTCPVGMMIEDDAGTILEVNPAICAMTGYSKEELEGSSVFETIVLAENQAEAKENIARILAGEDLEFETETVTKNGEVIYFRLKETSLTLEDGSKGILSMQNEITERKQAENKLKQKNKKLNGSLTNVVKKNM